MLRVRGTQQSASASLGLPPPRSTHYSDPRSEIQTRDRVCFQSWCNFSVCLSALSHFSQRRIKGMLSGSCRSSAQSSIVVMFFPSDRMMLFVFLWWWCFASMVTVAYLCSSSWPSSCLIFSLYSWLLACIVASGKNVLACLSSKDIFN